MKSTELRIGNLVYGISDRIETITEITETHLTAYTGLLKMSAFKTDIADFSPIPLTTEWLFKLGANKNQLPNTYWISVPNLKAELHFEAFDNTIEIVTTLISQSCDLILDRIKHVHEYQNIYFALSGEELTIKN